MDRKEYLVYLNQKLEEKLEEYLESLVNLRTLNYRGFFTQAKRENY